MRTLLFRLLVAAVLLLPSRPGAPAVALPLELPAILLLLLAAPPALRRPLAWLTTLLLATLTVLKLADIGFQAAYLRPFNPVLDAGLLRSAWELGQGSLGTPLAVSDAMIQACTPDLDKWTANVRPGTILGSGPTISKLADNPDVHRVTTPREAVDRIQADLRVVSDEEFPFALNYFTGSKEHNIVMRQRAIARGPNVETPL